MFNQTRVRTLNEHPVTPGPILYWMSRDQRAHDNWALLFAQALAKKHDAPLVVAFCLAPSFLHASSRQYDFMLKGLTEVEAALHEHNISFAMLLGEPHEEIARFAATHNAGAVVTDFSPLRIKRTWTKHLETKLECAFFEVDAHNIIPAWHASPKQEFGAYTLRPKIKKLLPEYLSDFPRLTPHHKHFLLPHNNWAAITKHFVTAPETSLTWITPGEKAAHTAAKKFLDHQLPRYATERNDPTKDAQSNLSPYLHFGQLSAQRLALMTKTKGGAGTEDFLEEMIVRRELGDNFCLYNPHYDSYEGAPAWAIKSLEEHRNDKREFVYSLAVFEHAKTHDPLWNAAQREMVSTGKMHGYMRMYWAKKILEWTETPEDAVRIAILLNDKYELDGRDPNGYTGVMWSICGVHDRAWFDRPVYGKIRYMSYNGAKGKFDVGAYIARFTA